MEQHQGAVKSGGLVAVAFQGDFKPKGTHDATSHQIGQARLGWQGIIGGIAQKQGPLPLGHKLELRPARSELLTDDRMAAFMRHNFDSIGKPNLGEVISVEGQDGRGESQEQQGGQDRHACTATVG